ncbi:hypothetical protein EBU99_12425 [bacterium]|nr:hypothetical protein [bacterium]
MSMGPAEQKTSGLSYELYRELVDELLAPIEHSLDCNVRYELYLSKLVYLENLQEQCFRSVNSNHVNSSDSLMNSFTHEDLQTIQDAIISTHNFLRSTILEALEQRLSQIAYQGQSV